MEIPGIGKDLHWWQAVAGISAAALVACIARGWENGATIAAGFAAFGLGQWMNHPLQTTLYPGYNVKRGYPWRWGLLGLLAIVGGLAVAGLGIYRALF